MRSHSRFALLVLTLILLPACHHDFSGPVSQDVVDRDPDAGPRKERRTADNSAPPARTDWREPDFCTALSAVAPSTGCSQPTAWTCRGGCDGVGHLACLSGGVLREIRCGTDGSCQCQVGNAAPVACPKPELDNGRRGCALALEVLQLGCCKP